MIQVSTQVPDLNQCARAVADASCGAVLTFLGVVRDHHGGHPVARLSYDAYVSMAERELTAIAEELKAEFGVVSVAIQHRIGELAVGDVAMAVAVSAAHRGPALRAMAAAVDRIKDRVPIWKKEHYGDGTSTWLGADGSAPPTAAPRVASSTIAVTPPSSCASAPQQDRS